MTPITSVTTPLPKSTAMHFKRITGFTLIELMVAVSVMGILMTIGMPAMRDVLLNQKIRTGATGMHLSMMLARSEAIKRNGNIDITNSTNWNNGWDVQIPSSTVLRSQEALPDLTIECNTDNDTAAETCPSTITFTRTGRATSFIEFRMFVSGNTGVTMRCVSLRLSGTPQVTVDSDSTTSDGCD